MRKLFKERKLFKGGNYMRKYGILKELCQFEIDHMIQEPGFFLRAHNEALKQEMVNW